MAASTPLRAPLLAGLLAFFAGLAFNACGTTGNRCSGVVCEGGRVCNPDTGACLTTDGGTGGSGGGVGGGTGGGGGATTGCSPACTSPEVCHPTTNTCVACLSDADCACPTSWCSASNTCIVPTAGAEPRAGGETCSAGPTLKLCTSTLTFRVDLSAARDDAAGSCSATGSGGKELAWQLVLEATSDVEITAQPVSGSLAEPLVYLRRGCDGAELSCADGLGGQARVKLKSLPAGTYGVFFDTYDAAAVGEIEVTMNLTGPTAPGNETCATATPLLTDGTTVQVDLSVADDDGQLSCNSRVDSPEVFYAVTLDQTSDLLVTATPTTDGGVDAVLGLRASPCATGQQLACADRTVGDAVETLRARSLAPGTYYLAVESWGRATAGALEVKALAQAPTNPPPNDGCAAPRVLNFPAGVDTLSFAIDTSTATDDETFSCNIEADSYDVVYELTLGTSRVVTVNAQALPGTLADSVIALRTGACGSAGTELACADGFPGDTFTQRLQAGTYWLHVESYGAAGAGPTTVTVTLAP